MNSLGAELDREPCPMGCGNLTEDPYGGPCAECWEDAPEGSDRRERHGFGVCVRGDCVEPCGPTGGCVR